MDYIAANNRQPQPSPGLLPPISFLAGSPPCVANLPDRTQVSNRNTQNPFLNCLRRQFLSASTLDGSHSPQHEPRTAILCRGPGNLRVTLAHPSSSPGSTISPR